MCKKLVFLTMLVTMVSPVLAHIGSVVHSDDSNFAPGLNFGTADPRNCLVAENNWGAWESGEHCMSQEFLSTSGFTAKAIGLYLAGAGEADITVRLYDIGDQPLMPVGGWGDTKWYDDAIRISSIELLKGAWFHYEYETPDPHIVYLNLTEDEFVNIYSNEVYMLELISSSTPGWMRGPGISSVGYCAIAMTGAGEPMGEIQRTAALGFYNAWVPEPATMVLLGLGSLALLRRKK